MSTHFCENDPALGRPRTSLRFRLYAIEPSFETLGGTVMAANRPQGGLSIRISLPTLA